jgi:hypothetical protein
MKTYTKIETELLDMHNNQITICLSSRWGRASYIKKEWY